MKKKQKRNIIYKKNNNKLLKGGELFKLPVLSNILKKDTLGSMNKKSKMGNQPEMMNGLLSSAKKGLFSTYESDKPTRLIEQSHEINSSSAKGMFGKSISSAKGMFGDSSSSAKEMFGKSISSAKGMFGDSSSSLKGVFGDSSSSAKGMIESFSDKFLNPAKSGLKNNFPINSNKKQTVESLLSQKKTIINKIIELEKEKEKLLNNETKLYKNKSNVINAQLKFVGKNNKETANMQSGGTLQNQLNNIQIKKDSINEKIKPLEEELSQLNMKLTTAQGGLTDNLSIESQGINPKSADINEKTEIVQNNKPQTFMQKIKLFLNSDFFTFIKYYMYFIVLFAIIFYITIRVNNNTKNSMILVETKIFFYISLIILFIIINDILETPVELMQQFLYVLLFTLIVLYIVTYLVEHYYIKDGFFDKLKIVLLCAFVIFIIMVIYIYFTFQKKNKNIATELFNCFNYGISKNLFFTVFLMLYLLVYYGAYYFLNWNSSLTDMLLPFILGVMVIFFIFCLIIYISLKMKIINRIQILNTFISLGAIFIFLSFVCAYIFMSSLDTMCKKNTSQESLNEQEIVSLLIIASIFTILWLDDTRNWKQYGSILFVFATIIALYCMFYYSVTYPSTGMLSTWLFIEWIIILFYRNENSKNSIHYSFMKT